MRLGFTVFRIKVSTSRQHPAARAATVEVVLVQDVGRWLHGDMVR